MEQNEFNLTVAQALGRIETKIDILAGPNGGLAVVKEKVDGIGDRVIALETDRTRNWWFTVGIAPVLAAVYALLRYFGIHV